MPREHLERQRTGPGSMSPMSLMSPHQEEDGTQNPEQVRIPPHSPEGIYEAD